MIDPREFETLIAETLLFLQESAAFAGEPFSPILLQASKHLYRIYQRVQRVQCVNDRFVVAVVGLSNVGKSTLINGLLGDQFSPSRNGPCTSSPVEFACGTSYRVSAYPRGDFRRRSQPCQSPAEVQKLVNLYVDQPSDQGHETWERVVVDLEHPLLQHGLVLADTPGFGAAQIGDQPDAHSQAVRAYLQHSVAQVFWVVFGEQGIGQRERVFYQEWLSGLCDDVVVTAREEWDDRDKSRFLDRYRTLFVDRMPAMHFVGHATELQTEPVAFASCRLSAGD
jgi:GTP-binding protein EngB required for normal cell division